MTVAISVSGPTSRRFLFEARSLGGLRRIRRRERSQKPLVFWVFFFWFYDVQMRPPNRLAEHRNVIERLFLPFRIDCDRNCMHAKFPLSRCLLACLPTFLIIQRAFIVIYTRRDSKGEGGVGSGGGGILEAALIFISLPSFSLIFYSNGMLISRAFGPFRVPELCLFVFLILWLFCSSVLPLCFHPFDGDARDASAYTFAYASF